MPKLMVTKAFILTRDDGSTQLFPAGINSFKNEDADHWFTKLHLAPEEEEAGEKTGEDDEETGEEGKPKTSRRGKRGK